MTTTYPHFHFRPSRNWINDPNGTIYHNGFYHIFYQYNPTSNCWGNLHWGHTRTKDFIHYEILLDNLFPQHDKNEFGCYSGCIAINSNNRAVALYTSVSQNNDITPNLQKAVLLDENIEHFDTERTVIITKDHPNLPEVRNDWRDPYVFKADGRNFLIIGAAIGEKKTPSVLLFENEDGSLLNWKYIKELISFKPVIELFECPNFFKLQDKWVLLGSPYKEVEYYVGSFDVKTLDFTIENSGLIDHCAQFYATNTIQDTKGRTIIVAFQRGFSKNQGWNNVLSIPRQLSINENNEIIQKPIYEISSLRKEKFVDDETFSLDTIMQFEDDRLPQSEINFTVNLDGNLKTNLIFRGKRANVFQILFSSTGVKFDTIFIPFKEQHKIEVKLFIDHSIIELYLHGGSHCATRVVEAIKDLSIIEFRGNGSIEHLHVYEMGDVSITEKN